MKRRIGIIGMQHTGLSLTVLRHIAYQKDIEIIMFPEPEKQKLRIIEVNGTQYIEALKNESKDVLKFAEVHYGDRKERKLTDTVDIVNEFRLIKNKQSKLSRWERDMVEKIFTSNYLPIK